MNLFYYEFKKLFSNKLIIFYLVLLVLSNIFLQFAFTEINDSEIRPSSYKKLSLTLDSLTDIQKKDYIYSEYEKIEALNTIDNIVSLSIYNPKAATSQKNENKEIFEKYWDLYKNKKYVLYTESLIDEFHLFNNIKSEISTVSNYTDFLSDINTKVDAMSKISVFGNSDSFDYKNAKKTQLAFNKLNDVKINYYPQKGFIQATQFIPTDIILFFIIILLSINIVYDEKESGLISLIRSTSSGRMNTALAKTFSLFVYVMIATFILYFSNFFYCNTIYNLGDLTRSVQSIPLLMRSTLKLNILEYIFLFLFIKGLAAFIMGLWVLLSMYIAKNIFTGCMISTLLPVASLLIRFFIPANSKFNVIRYANIISLLQTNEIIGQYRNLHWINNNAINLIIVEAVFALLFTSITLFIFIECFEKKNIAHSKSNASLSFPFFKINIYFIEARKLLINNSALVMILLLCIFQIYKVNNTSFELSPSEYFYSEYMKNMTGYYDENAYNYLLNTQQDDFSQIINAKTQSELEYILDTNAALSVKYDQFKRVLSIVKQNVALGNNTIVYDTGFLELLNINSTEKEQLANIILISIFIIVPLAGFFSMEKVSGVFKIIISTPLGRKNTVNAKYIVALIYSYLIVSISLFSDIVIIYNKYGLNGIFLPANSIYIYRDMPDFISIFLLIILSFLTKLLAASLMTSVILTVSEKSQKYSTACMLSLLIFVFPLLLSYIYGKHFIYITIYPLMYTAQYLTSGNINFLIPLVFILFAFIIIKECYNTLVESYSLNVRI